VQAIVIGGGIGGLTAAIALRRIGAEVTLFERAPRLEATGAGLSLAANAMHALELLGVRDAIVQRGMETASTAILTAAGTRLRRISSQVDSRFIGPTCRRRSCTATSAWAAR
jgi:2-polyprenyl-6-methoxyphenol hydroxylase-like FAD-dependent oxidoreductase